MKIAILHEMLVKLGWAEKVVESWMNIFPEADIFTLMYDEKKTGNTFPKNKIHPQVFQLKSQKIYSLLKKQRLCLPFLSQSIEQLDFSAYDIVLCSSSGFAHGAITKPETKFIVYYHSPARYMWDWTNEYKRDIWAQSGIKWYILNKLFLKLRQWDFIASKRSDISLANSQNTQSRITKYYRKESEILFPPVETQRFSKQLPPPTPLLPMDGEKDNYYIIISALTEFKKIEIAIDAFNQMPEKKLIIIGQWDYKKHLENRVTNKNIEFVWAQYGDKLVELVQESEWLIFPGEEDFWIVPIEVMAAGKPIFAYRWGWLTETVIEWKTGAFFDDKNGKDFVEKFLEFDTKNQEWNFTPEACLNQAENFSIEHFEHRIQALVNS